jgi:hypothetical protein
VNGFVGLVTTRIGPPAPEFGAVAGAVVNDQLNGAANGLPGTSRIPVVNVPVYVPAFASGTAGAITIVRVASSYPTAAGTSALLASRSCTVEALIVVGLSTLLNVALRIAATLTPVVPFAGDVEITAGGTVSGVGGTISTRLSAQCR